MAILSKERVYITRMLILSLYTGIENRLTTWISRIIEWLTRGIFSGIMVSSSSVCTDFQLLRAKTCR